MNIIALEGTAHTFGCAVINEKGEILSDIRDTFTTKKGGMIPNEIAQHHRNLKDKIIKEAIEKSKQKKFDLVAYSKGPGFPTCLKVTRDSAIELAKKLKIPIVGANHAVAHLTSGLLFTKAKDPVFVYCSGANTQIIALEGGKYRVFGEVLSIAIGNALDKFGRAVGLGFPAGPKVEELAKKSNNYIELPYSVKGMDLSFSGIITKAIELYKKGYKKEDLAYSLQETCFAMLTEVTERALAHCNKKEALLIGGVAANKRFCEMLGIMCKERNAKFYACPLKYAGDNATMIAWQGFLEQKKATKNYDGLDFYPYQRTDQVEVDWD